jgi:uncharacterized protein (UPF0332 family)
MSQPEEISTLVNARLQQAQTALNEGKFLLEGQFYSGAVNRFYYTMFYAVLALLVTKQLGTAKHKGAISLFDREFVKPSIFSKDLSKWLHRAFEKRLEVDYADQVELSSEQVQELQEQANHFLAQINLYLQQYLTEP